MRPYTGYSSRFDGTDAQIVRPYTGYSSRCTTTDARPLDTSRASLQGLLVSPREKFADSSVEKEFSSRKGEMKLRKNGIEVPMNFFVARWIFEELHGGIVRFP